jgi:hypothetical protein
MSKTIFPLAAAVPLVLGVAGPPAAAATLDQEQPIIDAGGNAVALGGYYEQKLAQVVTAGLAGRLAEVRFPLECVASPADVVIRIESVVAGRPSGDILATTVRPVTDFPSFGGLPPEFRGIVIDEPAEFAAGDQFAITLETAGNCSIFPGPGGDSYPGGNSFFDSRPNPPGWVCDCEFAGSPWDLPFQTLVDGATTVGVDIKPGDFPNAVNPRSLGRLPVAILSSGEFDALTVDPSSVTFGATGVEAPALHWTARDANADGQDDLLLHFALSATGLACGDESASLRGSTYGGAAIIGTDSIRTVGCVRGPVK